MEEDGPDSELLSRYFRGTCSPEERERVRLWRADAGPMPDADAEAFPDIDRKALGKEILESVKGRSSRIPSEARKRNSIAPRPDFGMSVWKIAALLAFFLGTGFLAQRPIRDLLSHSREPSVEFRRYATAKGQKAKITLSDGTCIRLNADSEIRVPEEFSATERTIRLKGEAYFQVAKDPGRPFTVLTSDTRIRVLGTAFDVRAFPEEEATTVAVEDGHVSFARATPGMEPLLLTAGGLGRYSNPGNTLDRGTGQASDYLAWKENRLVFNNMTFSEIAVALERWYGLRVEIRSRTLAAARFTGTYSDPDLSGLLKDMSLAAKFQFTLNRRTLILDRP